MREDQKKATHRKVRNSDKRNFLGIRSEGKSTNNKNLNPTSKKGGGIVTPEGKEIDKMRPVLQIVLRTIKAGTETPSPGPDASNDDMTDDDVSDLFRARPSSATSDVSVSSQGTRRASAREGGRSGSVLSSEEFDGIAVESLRWLRGAWTEYPLEVG